MSFSRCGSISATTEAPFFKAAISEAVGPRTFKTMSAESASLAVLTILAPTASKAASVTEALRPAPD